MRCLPLTLCACVTLGAGCATTWREGAAGDLATTASALSAQSQELSATLQQLYVARARASQGPDAGVGEIYFAVWSATLFPDQPLSSDAFERKLLELEQAMAEYPQRIGAVDAAAWSDTEASKKMGEIGALAGQVSATTSALSTYYGETQTAENTAAMASQLTTLIQIETLLLQQAIEGGQ